MWESFEKIVDQKSVDAGKPKLSNRARGRGATLRREFIQNKVGPIKAARHGEPNPTFGGLNLQLKRWFCQWRRLINLVRLVQKDSLTLGAKQHARALWRAIMQAPGFDNSFAAWWMNRPKKGDEPAVITGEIPYVTEVIAIRDVMEVEIRNFESILQKSKGHAKDDKHQQNPNQVFRDVKDPRSLPVEVLVAKTTIKATEIVDQGSILFETTGDIDEKEPIIGDAFPLNIVVAEEGQMWFDKEHTIVEGQELFQTKNIGTLQQLFDAFGKEWSKRWDKHKRVDESKWDPIVEFAEQCMPSKKMHVEPITVEMFRHIAKSKPTAAAVGLDGVSCKDICNLPEKHFQSLLSIINHAELTGQWPYISDASGSGS